ncbi:hypothetical protein M3Y99_01524400 [Aphelenchoides fujianensis]|nr:hypothetical protein M3Y99_01524400 [Aphelenchoides fujianensis]
MECRKTPPFTRCKLKRKAEADTQEECKRPKIHEEMEHKTASKPQPKIKADVRRILMLHALSTKLEHNKPTPGPNFYQERAALCLRTLRTFFCCRSFLTVFFTPSEKRASRGVPALALYGTTIALASDVFKPLHLVLESNGTTVDSLERFLLLGRTEVRKLEVKIFPAERPTAQRLCNWVGILRFLQTLEQLESVQLTIKRMHKSAWIVHLLRDLLPPQMNKFFSTCAHDFLFVQKPLLSVGWRTQFRSDEQPCPASFIRTPTRAMSFNNCLPAMAAYGPRGFELVKFAAETGFSKLTVQARFVLPNQRTAFEAHERLLAATSEYFAQQPFDRLENAQDLARIADELSSNLELVCVWTARIEEVPFDFVLVSDRS